MKKFLILLILIFSIGIAQAQEIIMGTLVKVYARKPISTELYQIGDFVYFVNPLDMWQGTSILIPKNTVFTGYINTLTMPVQGINASFSMKINKMITPDGKIHDINAIITYQGQELIGGNKTNPASYTKAIHYIAPHRGLLQWVPSGELEFGKHTTITQKDDLYITFKEKLILKD